MIWLDRSLIRMPGYYGLCTTPEDFAKAMKRMNIPVNARPEVLASAHANATMHTFEQKGKVCCIVYMPLEHAKTYPLEECYAMLVHEGIHIWQRVREYIGEHSPSKEFEAYSVQMITQELMYAWKEATDKPKAIRKKLTIKNR